MATELLQQKIANLRAQLDSHKLELYLLKLQLDDVTPEPTPETNEFGVSVYNQLFGEARNARARVMYLQRKIDVRAPLLADLVAEQAAVDAATKPAAAA